MNNNNLNDNLVNDYHNPRRRYFKISTQDGFEGRYTGKCPRQAAGKAFTQMIKKRDKDERNNTIQFSIIECTRGSKKKTYKYSGKRIELAAPIVLHGVNRHNNIGFKFINEIYKAV